MLRIHHGHHYYPSAQPPDNKNQQHDITTSFVREFSSVYAHNLPGNDLENARLTEQRLGHTRGGVGAGG